MCTNACDVGAVGLRSRRKTEEARMTATPSQNDLDQEPKEVELFGVCLCGHCSLLGSSHAYAYLLCTVVAVLLSFFTTSPPSEKCTDLSHLGHVHTGSDEIWQAAQIVQLHLLNNFANFPPMAGVSRMTSKVCPPRTAV